MKRLTPEAMATKTLHPALLVPVLLQLHTPGLTPHSAQILAAVSAALLKFKVFTATDLPTAL
jgi:hypothetical protein